MPHLPFPGVPRRLPPFAVAAACLLLGACAQHGGYLHQAPQPSLLPSAQPTAAGNRAMYLDLIRQMQQKGAYYASLAHIDAYRQRYGNPPELRRLQADALRETGQAAQAEAVYRGLLDTDQVAAAWHGLGLIDAARGSHVQADQALVRAVRLEPINVNYLGDLGFARLQAGQVAAAREPLAKAAELAPDSAKAVSNLALWMMLSDEYAQADALMQRAALPAATRQSVRRLAMQLRTPQPTSAGVVGGASGTVAAGTSAVSGQRTQPPARIAGIPGSMLERFGPTSATSSEAQP
jgi:Flp pilus assembly protein TadD